MAALRTTSDTLRVELTVGEKLASLRGDLVLPLAGVRSVTVEAEPLQAVQGIRAPGLGLPRRAAIGTWRRRGRRSFAAAHRGRPAVRVELVGAPYDRIVVSVPDPDAVAERLRRAVETRGAS